MISKKFKAVICIFIFSAACSSSPAERAANVKEFNSVADSLHKYKNAISAAGTVDSAMKDYMTLNYSSFKSKYKASDSEMKNFAETFTLTYEIAQTMNSIEETIAEIEKNRTNSSFKKRGGKKKSYKFEPNQSSQNHSKNEVDIFITNNESNKPKNKTLTPIQIVTRIFDNYIKNDESVDSQANKDAMSSALQNMPQLKLEKDLIILIDVWLYYDPTDYPTRDLVYSVLDKNRIESIKAVKTRISKKKKWESNDKAPFSELKNLELLLSK